MKASSLQISSDNDVSSSQRDVGSLKDGVDSSVGDIYTSHDVNFSSRTDVHDHMMKLVAQLETP